MEGIALRVRWNCCSLKNVRNVCTVFEEAKNLVYSSNHASIELAVTSILGKYDNILLNQPGTFAYGSKSLTAFPF